MKIRAMILMVGTLALLVVGMVAVAPGFGDTVVRAQAPTPVAATPIVATPVTSIAPPAAPPPQQDNSGRWGLLGLLGLAGLAGLLKRPQTEVRTIETHRVEQPRVEPPRERTR